MKRKAETRHIHIRTSDIQWRTVGIVGYGAFGAFLHILASRFIPDTPVRVYVPGVDADGKLFFSLDDVADCDIVILAVPMRVFEEVLQEVLPLMRPEAILVDVATVKGHFVDLLERYAPDRLWIATHPMFGPESFQKRGGTVNGLRIVVSKYTIPRQLFKSVQAFLVRLGFNVVILEAKLHDSQLARTLFLTHFIAQTISCAGFDRTEIDTASFGWLMDAVSSVAHDTDLFLDVFKYNTAPCEKTLARIDQALHNVRTMIEGVRK